MTIIDPTNLPSYSTNLRNAVIAVYINMLKCLEHPPGMAYPPITSKVLMKTSKFTKFTIQNTTYPILLCQILWYIVNLIRF